MRLILIQWDYVGITLHNACQVKPLVAGEPELWKSAEEMVFAFQIWAGVTINQPHVVALPTPQQSLKSHVKCLK